jgi:hypothetical protein
VGLQRDAIFCVGRQRMETEMWRYFCVARQIMGTAMWRYILCCKAKNGDCNVGL